jgi:hypothetical protein
MIIPNIWKNNKYNTNIPNHQPEFTGTHTPSSGVKSPAGIV